MSVFQAFILGIVQGVTEFLPISSSGFLILIPELFGWKVQALAFDGVVHLATLAAVVTAVWSEVRRKSMWKVVILATIPVLVAGFFLHDVIETTLRSGKVVAWSFIVWGVVLYVSDRMAVLRKDTVEQVGIKRAMIIGFSQVLALIPGTSRSGITITAGLFSGLSRRTAATFSFLLAVPTIAAAGLLTLSDVFFGKNPSATSIGNLQLLVGFVTAFVTAFLTIKVFLTFLDKHSFAEIAVFRVVIGVLILLLI